MLILNASNDIWSNLATNCERTWKLYQIMHTNPQLSIELTGVIIADEEKLTTKSKHSSARKKTNNRKKATARFSLCFLCRRCFFLILLASLFVTDYVWPQNKQSPKHNFKRRYYWVHFLHLFPCRYDRHLVVSWNC